MICGWIFKRDNTLHICNHSSNFLPKLSTSSLNKRYVASQCMIKILLSFTNYNLQERFTWNSLHPKNNFFQQRNPLVLHLKSTNYFYSPWPYNDIIYWFEKTHDHITITTKTSSFKCPQPNIDVCYKGTAWMVLCIPPRLLRNIITVFNLWIMFMISSLHDHVGSFRARTEFRQTRRVPPSCNSTYYNIYSKEIFVKCDKKQQQLNR